MKPEHIYRRQRIRAYRAAGLCRCGRQTRPGRASCGCRDDGRRGVSVSDASYAAIRKAALRSGRTMRAEIEAVILARLARMGVG